MDKYRQVANCPYDNTIQKKHTYETLGKRNTNRQAN